MRNRTRISHATAAHRRNGFRRRRAQNERGWVMAVTAFAVTAMIGASALAIDVSGWWVQTAKVQSAADAAALAGVVWLPNLAKARATAIQVAADNGYPEGNGISVDVSRAGRYQLKVSIRTPGKLYFGKAFRDHVDLGRSATAQYTLPVPLGSPSSAMGLNTQTPGGFEAQEYWLAISGYCKSREQGDLLSAGFQATYDQCPAAGAVGDTANPDYDPEGYWFVLDKPATSGSVSLDAWDLGECAMVGAWGNPPPLEWTLYAADDTPLDDHDNPVFAQRVTTESEPCDAWSNLFTVPAGAPEGRWLLNVHSRAEDMANGINRFGLWARRAGDASPCSVTTSSACPQFYARDALPMLVWGAATPTFSLAEISPDHAGKQLQIDLFDTAEGMESVQILDPAGHPVSFTYQTVDGDYGPSTNETCDSGPCLRVDVTGPVLVPGQLGNGSATVQDRYNNRIVRIHIQLPDRQTLEAYPNGWWSLRYKTRYGFSATDRTTWTVSVNGDPVKLAE